MNNAALICGNSHPDLTSDISRLLQIPLVDSQIGYFSNTEVRIRLNESIRGKDIYIIQTGTYNKVIANRSVNDHLMETIFIAKTCKRSDAKTITLIMPCYPYARQDKKDNPRGCISARDVADLLESSGITRIVCIDLHCPQIQGFFNIPCDNLYCIKYVEKYLFDNVFNRVDDYKNKFVVIAPDEGALKRVQEYASILRLPHLILSKQRDYTVPNVVEKVVLIGEKKYLIGKTAIIIDDMCDTCGTVQKVSELIVQEGAKDIIVIVSHGILSGPAIERLNSAQYIKSFICSDSIPQTVNLKNCDKLKVFSISPLLADVVKNLIEGKSVSALFSS